MNLSKLEKTFIIILVVGGILAAGIFLFIKPAYESIGTAETRLANLETEKTNLYAELEREKTIDDEIATAKDTALTLEGGFYPDLTTYEAVEIVLAHLKDSGLDSKVYSATELTTYDLLLEKFNETPVIYDLKTYAESARGEDQDALLEGQFRDDDKVYTITANSVTDISITDEEGTVVERENYTDVMVDAYKEALVRTAATNSVRQQVGLTSVTIEAKGEYKKYLEFIDYLYNLERATYMTSIEIPMTYEPEADTEEGNIEEELGAELVFACEDDTIVEGTFAILFFSVEQMEELDTLEVAGSEVVVNQ